MNSGGRTEGSDPLSGRVRTAMKIGVVSDTHVSDGRRLPEDLFLALAGVDGIVHCGDVTGLSVLTALERVAPVEAVHGNMDPPATRRALPARRVIRLGGFAIGVMHGSGGPSGLAERLLKQFRRERLDALLFGHSHRAETRTVDGVVVLNPGCPVVNPVSRERTVGILHVEDDVWGEIVRLDSSLGGGRGRG